MTQASDTFDSYSTLRAEVNRWAGEPDPVPDGWRQRRGYAWERILRALFSLEHLSPRANYRPLGEEIDGSFLLDGHTYLLEVKWRKDAMPASDLYAFKGKVDGKLVGTIGVFISQSGYSEDAIEALTAGKGLNIILFDGRDLMTVLDEKLTFSDAMRKKLRYATEYGQPFKTLSPELVPTQVVAVQRERAVIVEGEGDLFAIEALLTRRHTHRPLSIWVAGGASNLVPLATNLAQSGHRDIDILLDSNTSSADLLAQLSLGAEASHFNVISFEPSLYDILLDLFPTNHYNAAPARSHEKEMRWLARSADPSDIAERSPSFAAWWGAIHHHS